MKENVRAEVRASHIGRHASPLAVAALAPAVIAALAPLVVSTLAPLAVPSVGHIILKNNLCRVVSVQTST